MTLNLNGNTIEVNEGQTLQALLKEKGYAGQKGIAVAVNQEVVSKIHWDQKKLQENDNILIIQATQGG